jgi:hypothetical protein
MTRQEKIELLKGIASGAISVRDLMPKQLSVLIGYSENQPNLFIDGLPVTDEDFKKALALGSYETEICYNDKNSEC